jgi:hypothetical protein
MIMMIANEDNDENIGKAYTDLSFAEREYKNHKKL